MLERKHFAGAAEAGQNFVEDEHRARPIASFADRANESNLRNTHTALGLHWLDDHRSDRRIDFVERANIVERQMRYRSGQCAERLAHRGIPTQR